MPCRRSSGRSTSRPARTSRSGCSSTCRQTPQPGDYAGTLALNADGWSADVPLQLHVWNFTLPAYNHLETAFGFSPQEVFRYHNIRTEADRRKILDLYFQNFAAHRISPYDPTPLDPIRVTFDGEASPPRVKMDWSGFDKAMEHALATYHFTSFQLSVQGMGGGTYASRVQPSIGRYREGSPQYEALMSSYLRQVSDHLRAKGWINKSYVYWFDEPEPKDYAFVRAGMARIKKFAPEIPRMLTEEPGPDLAGSVDIWCPLTPNYNFRQCRDVPGPGRPVLVVRVYGPEGAFLHAVHRSPGHGVAGLALANLAEQGGGKPGLGDQLVDFAGGVSRRPAEPLR